LANSPTVNEEQDGSHAGTCHRQVGLGGLKGRSGIHVEEQRHGEQNGEPGKL
jgi:hypothetical protein